MQMGRMITMSLHNNKYNENLIKESMKLSKRTSFINLIMTTLICSGPVGWLILRILDNEIEKLLSTKLLTIPTLMYMGWSWCSYYHEIKIDKEVKELEDLVDKYENKLYKDK